jgi:hypothetical protein
MALLVPGVRRNAHLLVVTVMTCLTLPVRAVDQTSADDSWNRIVSAPEGSQVRVRLRDGAEFTARLVVARPDAVVVEDVDTGPTGIRTGPGISLKDGLTIARTDVDSIAVISTPRTRNTAMTPVSFDQLRVLVAPGQKINVTALSGARYSGRIVSLSSSTLTVRAGNSLRQLQEGDVAAIRQRRADSLGNGALWGVGAGFATGMVMCGRCHVGPGVGMGLTLGGVGAGIGVGIDALIRSDVVVFGRPDRSGVRVSIAPQLAKSHRSVNVSIDF